MKMMLFAIFIGLVATVICEESLLRDKRFVTAGAFAGAPWPFWPGFPFSGVYVGPYGGYGTNSREATTAQTQPAASDATQQFSPWGYGRNFVPFPYFPIPVFQMPQPWYEGENVCKTVKYDSSEQDKEFDEFLSESDFNSGDYNFSHKQCRGTDTRYMCVERKNVNGQVRREATKYACCYGFVRNPYGPGCIEINLKNILPTLRSIGALQFVKMAEKASMMDALHNGNYTIFCPANNALEAFVKDQELNADNEVIIKRHRRRLKKKMMYHNILTDHMTEGFYSLDDFSDGQIIHSENKDSQIRISMYYIPEKVVTANCVPILLADHFARNGIIHIVEKVLPMPSRTVADIIAGDPQFTMLKGMLGQAGLVQTLRNPNGTFTVFAPTDSAFTYSQLEREKNSNTQCITSVMKHHIIDHVICSAAIPQYARSLNMIGELLSLSRDEHNKLYVDDVQIVVRDLVATNGVVHIIDGLLSTRQAKVASEVLEEYGLKEFLYLLESAHLKGLYDTLDNVTFFIPSNEAIKAVPPALLESLIGNIDSLFSILLYHVAEGVAELNSAEQVFHSKMENTSLQVQIHAPYPHAAPQMLVQCATVLSFGNKICGGSLHIINKLLLPPKLSTMELLESLDGFSTLVLLLRATGMERRLKHEEGHFTLLAPTDDAFHQLGQDAVFKLLENLIVSTDLIKMHMLPGTVCCSRMKNDLLSGRPNVRAMEGSLLRLDRYREETLRIGGAHIVDCDIMASNGVIHMVDAIVKPHNLMSLNGGYGENLLIRI